MKICNILIKLFSLLFTVNIDEEILALSTVLGEVLERALDLVDNTKIKLLRSQHSSRELFEIKSESGTQIYRFFPNLPFCVCRSFSRQVIQSEEFCCKHYLAARIARALGKVEVFEHSRLDFRKILKDSIRF
jgi:hypothetical protein